jgi:hypothetical protein
MATFDWRILLETVEGYKTSYYSNPFVDTDVTLVMSASQAWQKITGSISCSYQDQNVFTGTTSPGSELFKYNTLLSASLTGSINQGGIVLQTPDNQDYDRLLRYKFVGSEKVCNVLGFPSNTWIYVDQFRLPADDEANYFEGDVKAKNLYVEDSITFANTSTFNSDMPILVDTGSDRYIKFVDTSNIPENALLIGYDKDNNKYEIEGPSTNFDFDISGVNALQMEDDGEIRLGNATDYTRIVVNGLATTAGATVGRGHIMLERGRSIMITGSGDYGGITSQSGYGTRIQMGGNANDGFSSINRGSIGLYGNPLNLETQNQALLISGSGTSGNLGGRVGINTGTPNSANSFTEALKVVGDVLIDGNLTTTQLTSSIVTSSVVFAEGSNIFGDDGGDTHTFNGSIVATNITASGTISASSTIYTNKLSFSKVSDDSDEEYIQYVPLIDAILLPKKVSMSYLGEQGVAIGRGILDVYPAMLTVNGTISASGALTIDDDINCEDIFVKDDVYIGNGTGTDEAKIIHNGDNDTHIIFDENKVNLVAGGWSAIKFDKALSHDRISINNTNQDLDTEIMGQGGDVLLHVDAAKHSVGIGTGQTIPASGSNGHLFVVAGDISASGDLHLNPTKKLYLNKVEDTYLDSDSTDRVRVVAGGQQMLVLDYDTGNRAAFGDTKVGIGAGDNHLPSHELEVDGVISASGNITSADGFTTSGNTITTGSITVGDLHHGAYISGSNGNMELSGSGTGLLIVEGDISASGTIYGAVFVSQSIGGDIIANTLRVNTDTAATNMEVTVEGSISASGDLVLGNDIENGTYFSASNDGQVRLRTDAGATSYPYLEFKTDGAASYISSIRANNTAANKNLILNSLANANVGIGNTDPPSMLTVQGDISASGDFILQGDGTEPFLSSSNGSLELSGSGFGQLQVDYRLFDTGSSTVASAGGGMGDIVKFGGSTTTAGQIYYLQAAGTWAQTDADAGETTSGSLALALGTNSTTHGMLLRGVGKLDSDPAGAVGAPIYLSTTAGRCTSIPQSSGDFSRVIGFNLDEDGLIYFNPDNTTIKVA